MILVHFTTKKHIAASIKPLDFAHIQNKEITEL
jgi:hypothetical protein